MSDCLRAAARDVSSGHVCLCLGQTLLNEDWCVSNRQWLDGRNELKKSED